MTRPKARHWSEDEARAVLARVDREGQSIAAAARELGVSPQKLYWWRQRLRGESAVEDAGFVEVRVTRDEPARPFVVHTRSGRAVTVWPGFDEDELERLLAVMEAQGC